MGRTLANRWIVGLEWVAANRPALSAWLEQFPQIDPSAVVPRSVGDELRQLILIRALNPGLALRYRDVEVTFATLPLVCQHALTGAHAYREVVTGLWERPGSPTSST